MAKIEFYVGASNKYIAVLNDGAVPRAEELINIQKQTYRIHRVTWALDSDYTGGDEPKLRACVEMTKYEQ